MKNIHYAGEVAFLETARGLGKVTVLEVIQSGNGWTSQWRVKVEFLEDLNGYDAGEIMTVPACYVIPPVHLVQRDGRDIIHIGFIWQSTFD